MEDIHMYKRALFIAMDAHEGQKRWNGDEYITHPIRVANQFVDYRLKTIGILHDVWEDTEVTQRELTKFFPIEIIRPLMYLTHLKNEPYYTYIYNIKKIGDATKVKIADLKDNLSDLENRQRRDKYELALLYLES